MQILYLPGYSLKNKIESDSVSQFLENAGYSVIRHEWRHWADESIEFDPSIELSIIKTKTPQQEYVLIAKSIGTYMAMRHLENSNQELVKTVVLMGLPLEDLNQEEKSLYIKVLGSFKNPAHVIMNEFDSQGTAAAVKELLSTVSLSSFFIKPGEESHEYNYGEDVLTILKSGSN